MTEDSKNIDDGGPAFQVVRQHAFGRMEHENNGMSLRDWFAGQVLAGFMSERPTYFNPSDDATYCYRVADAMIAARKAGA